MNELHIWRHPKPVGAAGLCLGRTDLPVDPRKARRLATASSPCATGWPRSSRIAMSVPGIG